MRCLNGAQRTKPVTSIGPEDFQKDSIRRDT
jgi:hypothetical protein